MKHFMTELNLARAAMTLLAAVLCLTGARADLVQIGNGSGSTTEFLPGYNYFNYSYSQQIYTSGEIGTEGIINSIAFYNGDAEKTRTYAIYMQHTDKATFASGADWMPMTDDDKVFEGSLTFTNGEWTTIVLDTPFEYNGNANLIVAVSDITGTYSDEPHMGCLYLDAPGQALSANSDDVPYNVSAPNVEGTLRDFKNQIQIDITRGAIPSVTKPKNIAVNYIGGTTAEVTWTSTEPAFDIDVNGTVTENVTSPYTLSDLALATTYTVKLRSKNGSEVSNWTRPISFTTGMCALEDQGNISYELTDSYDDGWSGNAIRVVHHNTGKVIATLTNASGASATGTVALCCGEDYDFEWVDGEYPDETGYVFKDINGDEIFSGTGALTATESYTMDCTVSAFRKPTDLAASEIGPHSAMLSWTENGEATEWVVSYSVNGEEAEHTATVTENPFTLTGLTVDTEYYVRVRPAGENDKWSKGIYVNTCFAVPTAVTASNVTTSSADISWTGTADSYNLRYRIAEGTENDFEDSSLDLWTTIDADGDGYDWVLGSAVEGVYLEANSLAGEGHDDSQDLIVSGSYSDRDGALTPDNYLVSPKVQLGGSISFWAKGIDPEYCAEVFGVAVSTTGNADPASFTMVGADQTATADWVQYTFDLSSYSGEGYVAIRHYNCTDMYLLDVDDIVIVPPTETPWTVVNGINANSYALNELDEDTNYAVAVQAIYADGSSEWCSAAYFTTQSLNPLPTNVAVDAQRTTATISWEGASESYKVKYRTAAKATTLWNEDFEDGLPAGWTTIDSDGDGNNWTTSSEAVDIICHSGSACMISASFDTNNEETLTPDNWLITPQLTLQGTLKLWARGQHESFPDEHFAVYVSTTDCTDVSAFTQVSSEFVATDDYKEYTADLSAYAGQEGYIAIRHFNCTNMFYLNIDDLGINLPDGIPAGEWQEVTTTETAVELTGLEEDTEYEYTVIGIKDGEENAGTAVKKFTTLAQTEKTFTTSGSWDVAENWTPAGVPTAMNDLIIQADVVVPAGVTATANSVVIDGGSITIEDGGQLKQNSDGLVVTIEKNINGYGESTMANGYYLIGAPLNENVIKPADVPNLLAGDYDFYLFSQNQNDEWRNYKPKHFTYFELAKGYLYANKEDVTLSFTGPVFASQDETWTYPIDYNSSSTYSYKGYHTIANVFPCDAYLAYRKSDTEDFEPCRFYKMNAAGDGWEVYEDYVKVAPGEAVIIAVNTSGDVYFSTNPLFTDEPLFTLVAFVPVLPQHGLSSGNDADLNLFLADDATNNESTLQRYEEQSAKVTLTGRTLYKDGEWNALTLPFNVTLADSPLAEATAKTLTAATMTGTTVSLTFGDAVEVLQANVPYIIKWEAGGENIVDPTFTDVTIVHAHYEDRTISLADGCVKFVGYYDAFPITAEDENIYYMASGSTLKHTGKSRMLKAFRAYFDFTENTGGGARQFILDFGDGNTTTAIDGVADNSQKDGEWFTVDGMKLGKQPVRKGLYINSGKKMVVK